MSFRTKGCLQTAFFQPTSMVPCTPLTEDPASSVEKCSLLAEKRDISLEFAIYLTYILL